MKIHGIIRKWDQEVEGHFHLVAEELLEQILPQLNELEIVELIKRLKKQQRNGK